MARLAQGPTVEKSNTKAFSSYGNICLRSLCFKIKIIPAKWEWDFTKKNKNKEPQSQE